MLDRDFIKISTNSGMLDLKVEEVVLGEKSPLAGKSVRASILESEFGVVVIAIKKKSGGLLLNTGEHGAVFAGDSLIIVGKDEDFSNVNDFLDAQKS